MRSRVVLIMVAEKTPQMIKENDHLILFDVLCNLCSAWVKFLIKRDPEGDFRFCSVQSDSGKEVLRYLELSVDQIETMAYVHRGKGYLRSAAFLQVVRILPAPWPVLSVGLYVPWCIRDRIYNLIAKNRYRIAGNRDSCLIPNEHNRERFI